MNRVDTAWRLLIHTPADGAWNMAVDETLLEHYAAERAPATPTLRLYAWQPAALSLGRHQRADGAHDPVFLRTHGLDLVRRPTGGGAVLHEFERTYAVIAHLRTPPFQGGVVETYEQVSQALCGAMRRLGLDATTENREARARREVVCFGAPSAHEISVGGLKIIGSAQRRRRGAFLQHGSILLRADPERLARAIGLEDAPRPFTDLGRLLGATPDQAALDGALVQGFADAFHARMVSGRLGAGEIERATGLRARKYLSAAWTLEGRLATEP